MNIVQQAAGGLERLEALDKVARPLAGAVGRAVRPRVVRNLLSGTDLGHPLPPMLTDLPIGAWVMSAPLDAADGPAAEGAADLLVTAGVVAAVPTAAAGLNDWSDTAGPDAASDRFGAAERALDTGREERAQARDERYAARQAHERATTVGDRLQRRVAELSERLDRMSSLRGARPVPMPAACASRAAPANSRERG